MAGGTKMKSNNLYQYFDMYRTEETIKQNHEEIEQAIDKVTGKDIDIKIKKIWERVLK
jgi:hypothetical protein